MKFGRLQSRLLRAAVSRIGKARIGAFATGAAAGGYAGWKARGGLQRVAVNFAMGRKRNEQSGG